MNDVEESHLTGLLKEILFETMNLLSLLVGWVPWSPRIRWLKMSNCTNTSLWWGMHDGLRSLWVNLSESTTLDFSKSHVSEPALSNGPSSPESLNMVLFLGLIDNLV